MKYITRALEPVLSRRLHQAPVVVPTGARQTGKSTLVQPFPNAAGRRYRSLDDLQNLELAQEAPNALLAERAPITGARPRCLDLISATGEPRQVKRWILLSNGRRGFCRSRSRALVGHEGPTRDTSNHSSVSIPGAVASASSCTLGRRPGSFPTTSSPFHCPSSSPQPEPQPTPLPVRRGGTHPNNPAAEPGGVFRPRRNVLQGDDAKDQ